MVFKLKNLSLILGLLIVLNAKNLLAQDIDKSFMLHWNKFNSFIIKGIDDFQKDHLKPLIQNDDLVFYPFGGPDVTYPLKLFPNVENFILVGLEPCGNHTSIAAKHNENDAYIPLKSLYRRGFYITSEMAKYFNKDCGIIPAIELQLKLLGATDINVNKISTPVEGIEINFLYNNKIRNIKYFRADLSDGTRDIDMLEVYIKSMLVDKNQITLLKSTSYTLHLNNFSKLRNLLISNSSLIVQDDSGIPLKYLVNDFNNINLYGKYSTPYGDSFKGFFQSDLKKLYDNKDNINIPFCFGYGCMRVPTNIGIYSNRL